MRPCAPSRPIAGEIGSTRSWAEAEAHLRQCRALLAEPAREIERVRAVVEANRALIARIQALLDAVRPLVDRLASGERRAP